jgi:hypothetical protein
MIIKPIQSAFEVSNTKRVLGEIHVAPLGVYWRSKRKQKYRYISWAQFEKLVKDFPFATD